jgi:hypothetical protein
MQIILGKVWLCCRAILLKDILKFENQKSVHESEKHEILRFLSIIDVIIIVFLYPLIFLTIK